MEIDEGMFRVGVRGFNKADVLAYIDSLNTAHASDLQNFQKLYAELQQSFGALQKVCAKLKSEFDIRGATIAELEGKLAAADETAAAIEAEKAALRSMAESGRDARDSYARLKARMDEIQAENDLLSKQTYAPLPDNSDEVERLLALRAEDERRISELEQQLNDSMAAADSASAEVGFGAAQAKAQFEAANMRISVLEQQLEEALADGESRKNQEYNDVAVEQLKLQLEAACVRAEQAEAKLADAGTRTKQAEMRLGVTAAHAEQAEIKANAADKRIVEMGVINATLEQQLNDAKAIAKTLSDNETAFVQTKVQLEIVKQQLSSAVLRAESAERSLLDDEGQRQKYQDFVGSIGSFMAELYSASHGIMQSTFRRSDDCLHTIEAAILTMRAGLEDVQRKVNGAREEIIRQNEASGERLNEIARDLSKEEREPVQAVPSQYNYNYGRNG